jgi:hypothetical protein
MDMKKGSLRCILGWVFVFLGCGLGSGLDLGLL